jgi:hypothetical protein
MQNLCLFLRPYYTVSELSLSLMSSVSLRIQCVCLHVSQQLFLPLSWEHSVFLSLSTLTLSLMCCRTEGEQKWVWAPCTKGKELPLAWQIILSYSECFENWINLLIRNEELCNHLFIFHDLVRSSFEMQNECVCIQILRSLSNFQNAIC